MEASEFAGEARDSGAALGDSATSDNGDVAGLGFIFLGGEGESVGPGVSDPLFPFDLASSARVVSVVFT